MPRIAGTTLLTLALTLFAGCALDKRPEDHAEHFFKKGQQNILTALKQAGATAEHVRAAEAILTRDKPAVVADVGRLLQRHRTMFASVATGAETADLLKLEAEFHTTHSNTLRTIGDMHAALRAAVGDDVWQKARERMQARLAAIYKE